MICLADLEAHARSKLPTVYADYFAGGANTEYTLTQNRLSLQRLQLWPRVLRGKLKEALTVDLLGSVLNTPIIASPTAFHKLAHPQGELATVRGLAASHSLMIVSMMSNTPIEEITRAAHEVNPKTGIWLQLYIQPDQDFTLNLVRRAEQAGCKAIVVTVDSPVFGHRDRDRRHGFNELPDGLTCPHMMDQHNIPRELAFMPELNWEHISWLCQNTHLPVVLKGIMHPQDVDPAIAAGAKAIIVSNHGGRQLDSAPATIDVLPTIAKATDKRIPLIMDGGIRRGTDVLKALALGASAVALGRSIIWGLCVNGEQGVVEVMQQMSEELSSALALCGCRSQADINTQLIFPNHFLHYGDL